MSNRRKPANRKHPVWQVSINGQATNLAHRAINAVEALYAAIREMPADLAAAQHLTVGVTKLTIAGETDSHVQAVPITD